MVAHLDGLVDINSATIFELQSLPGIGPKHSADIVAFREAHRPFRDVAELREVHGIGDHILSKLEGRICCGRSAPTFPHISTPHIDGPADRNEAMFFPDDRKGTQLHQILRIVAGAQQYLDVAIYSTAQDDLVHALEAAHKRGVAVRVITDDEQERAAGSCVQRLRDCGIPVRADVSTRMLMHHKFVVVDRKTLLDGSFNWTRGSIHGNNENVIVSSNSFLIEQFTSEFDRLWEAFGVGVEGVSQSVGSCVGDIAALFFPDSRRTNVKVIENELESAENSIDVAVFTLTSDELVDILFKKHRLGLRVRVITDSRQAHCVGADAQRLRDAGIDIRMNHAHFCMHHKFVVIDGRILINGSFNWTAHAADGNQENAVIWRHAGDLAVSFTREFERLWKKFAP